MAAKATADHPSPADPPRHTACAGLLQPTAQRAWNRGSWSGPAWCTPPSIITRFVLPPPPQAEDAASGLPGAATNLQRPPYGAERAVPGAQTAGGTWAGGLCGAISASLLPPLSRGPSWLPPAHRLLQFSKDLERQGTWGNSHFRPSAVPQPSALGPLLRLTALVLVL